MPIFLVVLMLLVLAAAGCSGLFAGTRQVRNKRLGFMIIKWTVIAAVVFFGVLLFERVA